MGAKPIVIASADAAVHYVLAKRIEDGEVKLVKRNFEDADLSIFGREEVDNVVDTVFVTTGGKSTSGMDSNSCAGLRLTWSTRSSHLESMPTQASAGQCGRRS